MKNKIFCGFTILVLLVAGSCKKKQCYRCYQYYSFIVASKGADTINYGDLYTATAFQDTINHLINLGYTIIESHGGYIPDPSANVEVCDTNSVYNGQPVRDSCSLII